MKDDKEEIFKAQSRRALKEFGCLVFVIGAMILASIIVVYFLNSSVMNTYK